MQGRLAGIMAIVIGALLAAATCFGVVTTLSSSSTQSDQSVETVMDYGTNQTAP